VEFGVALASDTESWKHVKRAEELGFSSSWFYDTQLLNPDVFICMALAAVNTSKIRLGTGVLIPSNRIEPVAANALATINKLAPGRVDFGVGTGFTARRTMGLKAIPLEKMKQYIRRVQSLLLGETVEWDFEQKTRKLAFLNSQMGQINLDDEIGLHVSAMGPKSRELVAELGSGWINFGSDPHAMQKDLVDMKSKWQIFGRSADSLYTSLFFLGAVLGEDKEDNNRKLMLQAAPWTAVMFHNLVESKAAIWKNLPDPLRSVLDKYRRIYQKYEPSDARHIENHRGHLMFLREEEKKIISPELVLSTTMSGSREELIERIRSLNETGYAQFVVQLVPGQEAAIEDWADIFSAV